MPLKKQEIKNNERTFHLKKGNINRMLSERWLWPKWIKHVAARVGSVHLSGWNVKINLQLKGSFFQPIINFSHKVFRSRLNSKRGCKNGQQKFQKASRFQRFRTKNRHASHLGWYQTQLTPYQSTSQSIKPRISNTRPRTLIAQQLTSYHVPQTTKQPPKNDLHTFNF